MLTEEQIARFFPGGVHAGTLPGAPQGNQADRAVLSTMQPGDACNFDRFLAHRPVPNQTEKFRLADANQFHAAHARKADGSRLELELSCEQLAKMFGSSR